MEHRPQPAAVFRLVVATLLLAGVAADAWNLPPRQSTVGRLLHPYPIGTGRIGWWYVVDSGGQWLAMSPEEFRALKPTLAPAQAWYECRHSRRSWTRGFWAPTRQTRWNRLAFSDGVSVDIDPPAAVRQVAAAYLRDVRGQDPAVANPLAAGDQHADRIIWSGWLHTSLALAAFVAALVVMPWRAIALWCRGRPPKPGMCAACGYDLTGLHGRCPECGANAQAPPAGATTAGGLNAAVPGGSSASA